MYAFILYVIFFKKIYFKYKINIITYFIIFLILFILNLYLITNEKNKIKYYKIVIKLIIHIIKYHID